MVSRGAGCVVMALTLVGCGRSNRAPSRADLSPENQAILNKLTGYRECLEDHSARVFEITDRYHERLGGQAPTESTDVLLLAAEDPKKCLEAIEAAAGLPPTLPELDAAGQAFAIALGEVATLTIDGNGRFRQGSPTYDPQRGRLLHPRLVAAFTAFDHAQGALFDQVYQLNRTAHADQLARREKREGRSLVVLADQMMLDAEALVRLAAIASDRLEFLDQAQLIEHMHRYEAAVEEMLSRALDNPKETETSYEHFSNVEERSRLYLTAAKQLAQRARDRVAYSETERLMIAANNEAAVSGTPAAMVRAYNQLVAIYWLK